MVVNGKKVITISFSEEYEQEYNYLVKIPNRSKYICEAIREYKKTNKYQSNEELLNIIKNLTDDIEKLKSNTPNNSTL